MYTRLNHATWAFMIAIQIDSTRYSTFWDFSKVPAKDESRTLLEHYIEMVRDLEEGEGE